MAITSTTHLNFRGQARAALEFYQAVFGGQVMIATYGQVGVPHDSGDGGSVTFDPVGPDEPDADRVAFGMVVAENGFRVAAYDVFGSTGDGLAGSRASDRRADGPTHTESLFVLVNGDSFDEISDPWKQLSDGATVIAPLVQPGPAAPAYGMLTDRFGVTWIAGTSPDLTS